MTNQISNSVDTAIARVQTAKQTYQNALAAADESKAGALNVLMSEVYKAGKGDFFVRVNLVWLTAALESRGIPLPKDAKQNRWPKAINLATGSWKLDANGVQTKEWEDGPATLLRYGRALRHMDEAGVQPEDALQYIRTYPGGLSGMIEADQAKHPAKARKPKGITQEAINKAKGVEPMAVVTVAKPAEVGDTEFGQAYGFWKGTEFCILGFVKDSGVAAQKRAVELAAGATSATGRTAQQQAADKVAELFGIAA